MSRNRTTLVTQLAHGSHGDNQLRGFGVGEELAGKMDAWSYVSLVLGHRLLDAGESAAMELVAACHCAADPRVWPLKIVRLVASYGSQVPAIVAGALSSDRGLVGWYAVARAIEFLARAWDDLGDERERPPAVAAWLDDRLASGGRVPGFGVPFRAQDERVVALKRGLVAQGRTALGHWKLAQQMNAVLQPKGLPINIGAASAAVVLDIGFSPAQADTLALRLMFENYLGNAVEGAEQAPAILRRLPDELIEDATHPPRESPRAAARRRGLSSDE